jgi:O-antigen biosynthesis protein WbqV
MTIAEAADLVIMAAVASKAAPNGIDHAIFMLEMGDPVSIMTIAETMIRLAGKKPHLDIPIVTIGARPGEKLHEALSAPGEEVLDIGVPSIFGLRTGNFAWREVETALAALGRATTREDRAAALDIMRKLYRPVGVGVAEAQDRLDGEEAAAPGDSGTGQNTQAGSRVNGAANVGASQRAVSGIVHLHGPQPVGRPRLAEGVNASSQGTGSSQEKHEEDRGGNAFRLRAR